MPTLKKKLADKIPAMREAVRALLADHGDRKISDVSISQAYGGMRGVKSLVTETSALDPDKGIRFRGYSIPEIQRVLPRPAGVDQVLPEGLFHLLLTGEVPSLDEVREITTAWRSHEELPEHTKAALDALPTDTHPMTQFSLGILSLQHESIFAREYRNGVAKQDLWQPMFDDAMVLLGRLPVLAAYIYRRSYKRGRHIPAGGSELDWAANLAHMLGVEASQFKELMRLYLTIHADHEGGNVSAHTTHLVGSALSDPYLALSAGMNGLAGPLHGLANQEVVRWIFEMKSELGNAPSKAAIEQYVWQTLDGGRVVPGYGHAVLRQTDPRYMAQREFALEHLPGDENFRLVSLLYEIVPGILREQGKAKNPWPNVDAHSGCLLIHYGVVEYDFYTVLFGVSRAMGVLSSLVWDRALGLPLERPKSVTTEWLQAQVSETVS
ncbi:MAG TPA: citrate (Si)-synthase, eukaryotic [Candidatus Polarisedimenticolaceae bacterium]|nr:citrate (Si)-synthase, eukaryotic [Candidatus Polarisedimenticolaceae bacterium]